MERQGDAGSEGVTMKDASSAFPVRTVKLVQGGLVS